LIKLGFDEDISSTITTYFKTTKEGFLLRGDKDKYTQWKINAVTNRSKCDSSPSYFEVEYWINKGFSIDKAKSIISNNARRDITYFTDKYGTDKGIKKYIRMCDKRKYSLSKEGMIKKYGEKEGLKRYINMIERRTLHTSSNTTSGLSNSFFNELILFNIKNNININIDLEYNIFDYLVDGYYKDKNIVIEFYGDYWHGNPLLPKIRHEWEKIEKQKYDNRRISLILNSSIVDHVLIIWENAFKNSKLETLDRCMKFLIKPVLNLEINYHNNRLYEKGF